MPTFELILLYRTLNTPALKAALKRSAQCVFDTGATIRKFTNLGHRELPFGINKRGIQYRAAHHFIFDYDAGLEVPRSLKQRLMLDLDVLRATSYMRAGTLFDLHFPEPEPECTMHLDLLPPPYRQKVIELQEQAKKKAKKVLTHKNYEDTQFLIF